MRIQPTKVEELDRSKPGLRLLVDLNLDAFRPLDYIQEQIQKKYHVRIALSTLSSYKQRRWLTQKKRVESIKEHAAAILDVLDKHGVGEVRQALLFERVQKALDDGAELDPHFMLSEERKWAALELKKQELEQAKLALELKIDALNRQRDREKAEVERAVNEAKDAKSTIERIREIYNVA